MNTIEVKDGRPPFVRVDHWIVELLPVIGATAFAVYAVLAKYASQETAQCYPSRKTIAREAGVSERSVDGALATLREHKAISAARRSVGQTAMRTSNLYTLLDRPREVGQNLQGDAQNLRTLSAESAGGVGQNLRLGGAESAQELEPKNNNHKEQEQSQQHAPNPPAAKPSAKNPAPAAVARVELPSNPGQPPREEQVMFDSLCWVHKTSAAGVVGAQRGRFNKLISEWRRDGVTPDDLAKAVAAFAKSWKGQQDAVPTKADLELAISQVRAGTAKRSPSAMARCVETIRGVEF